MKFLKLRLLLIAAIGFAFSGTANAQAVTQNIDVTAFVPNVCIVDVATTETTMLFDLSGVSTATLPFDATTTLAWRCSVGFAPAVTIGPTQLCGGLPRPPTSQLIGIGPWRSC